MGHKHTKEEILEGALAAAFDDGLSQLTFGRLAKRLGINDRVVVYYFPSKDDLTIHVDANPNVKFKSSRYVKELTSLVVSQGFHAVLKPDSWCASHCADHVVKNVVIG